MQNPFNPYQPAEGKLFANRKHEQAWFRRDLIPSLAPDSLGTYNAAILGPWGIGKSSLVHQLRYLTQATSEHSIGMAFMSCTTGFGSMMGFCTALVDAVRNEALRLSGWDQQLQEELAHWSLEIRIPGVTVSRSRSSSPVSTVSAAEFLRTSLLQLWERVFHPRGVAILIVLDDVNLLQMIDGQSLMLLRAIFQDLHLYQARYALVITGPPDLFSEIRDVSEPVTRFFEHLPLSAFTLEDAQDAIRDPLKAIQSPITITDAAVEWLWEKTQGHPYFITYAMHYGYQMAEDAQWTSLGPMQMQAIWPAVLGRLEHGKFSDDWNAATSGEQKTLIAIVQGQHQAINTGLVTRLVRKGLVTKRDRGHYTLYHPMFRDFVLHAAETNR
ncbi:MAG: hypothetical protein C7B46_10570 [Sulfobacillus benefaciens]|uniref:Orc1-like AAA ATPase domain-containing protein n=1 Tax=Sulfobacillus benefaciens TaxID=453960 RepID=A0A2T2XFJ1_9FIRM|nr:MAG: hypothetical protein C7B46_10570 [Sulfobacillus benefaciens]